MRIADACALQESIALLISDPSITRLYLGPVLGTCTIDLVCVYVLCIKLCNLVQSSPIACTRYRVGASPFFLFSNYFLCSSPVFNS